MNAPICFVDTETTGIHPGRRAWEIAIIRREPDGTEGLMHAFVKDVDLSEADPFGLKIGRFYERHPKFANWPVKVPGGVIYLDEDELAPLVEQMTRGAHLVGAVPNFDAEVFADMLRRHQLTPAWHYHLIDVENLAVGYLHGRADENPGGGVSGAVQLPWGSDELSKQVGVKPAAEHERHTALGDARWAMRLYDAITGSRAVTVDA